MRRQITRFVPVILFALALTGPATAGERFKEGPPTYYTCKSFALDHTDHTADSEGNKQTFAIWVTGICAPRREGAQVGGWTHVTSEGHYDYGTGKTSERVTTTSDDWVAVQLQTSCSSNPWAHDPSCSAPSQLDNNTGMSLQGPYPISAHLLPGHLRQALADWEDSKTNEQLLVDWDPLGPPQEEELVITKPGASVPENSPSFEVALNALHPQTGWIVQLEWARILPPKDPSIEIAGSWHYDQPSAAPKTVPWSGFPVQVPIPGAFTPGEYALRAKVQGHAENTWTNWKRFWIGKTFSGNIRSQVVKLAGGQTQTYSMDQPGQAVVFGQGKVQQYDFRKQAQLAPGQKVRTLPGVQMEAKQGQAPTGPTPSTPKLGTPTARMATAIPSNAASADLVLDAARAGVKGELVANAPIGLTNVRVKNDGRTDSPAGRYTVALACQPLGGGSCQVLLHAIPLPAIAPGKSHALPLDAAFKPSQSGKFRLSLKLEPAAPGASSGKSWSKDVEVAGARLGTDSLQKAKIPASPTTPRLPQGTKLRVE